ncbi:hypothetical protein E7V67_000425 [[Empedobacter] haloabium]|uniref:Uncharacterized protein n=1 Tax=[Empedobacter] haloabium TaxID=592317 RepID=A0ABZ1UMR8_9BURK
MTLYQKIPTTSTRIHPLMAGAAIAVILLSAVATAAIVGWLPAARTAAPIIPGENADVTDTGYATVSSPVPATAARASSATTRPASAEAAPRRPRLQPA